MHFSRFLFILLTTWCAVSSAGFKFQECDRNLRGQLFISGLKTAQETEEFQALATRLRINSRVYPQTLSAKYTELVNTFQLNHGRFLDPYFAISFLRAVVVSSERMEDLDRAIELIRTGGGALEYEIARREYYLHKYEESLVKYPTLDPRTNASMACKRFEAKVPRHELPEISDRELLALEQMGIRVAKTPIAGLRFNTGIKFELKKDPTNQRIQAAAAYLSEALPDETVLGMTSDSVLNFRRLFVPWEEGLSKPSVAASLLSIRKHVGMPYEFVLRFFLLNNQPRDVAGGIPKALERLVATAEDLRIRYPEIDIGEFEIGGAHDLPVGADWRRSDRSLSPNVYELQDANRKDVAVTVGNGSYRMLYRILPPSI